MAIALLDTDGLVEELNALRNQGRVIKNEFRIRGLQKRIDALRKDDPDGAAAFQASLWCLTGNFDCILAAVDLAVGQDTPSVDAVNHVLTLASSGFFSRARELFARLDDRLLTSDFQYLRRGVVCFAYSRMIELAAGLSAAETKRAEPYMDNVSKGHDVLAKSGVSERDLARMLDVAGSVLRDHGLFSSADPQMFPYPSLGTVTISLPVMLSAEEVAELEWEFCQRLFTEIPDAPVHVAQVGFCVGVSDQ